MNVHINTNNKMKKVMAWKLACEEDLNEMKGLY